MPHAARERRGAQAVKASAHGTRRAAHGRHVHAPMLPKDADGNCPQWCPATHFGYLESGEMGLELKDGTKQVVKAGESYLVGPGHRPIMNKAAVMIEFSQDP